MLASPPGHEGAINAVTFDGAGQRLATFSAAEGRVRFWETGHSGTLLLNLTNYLT